jgi:hypothetical protein
MIRAIHIHIVSAIAITALAIALAWSVVQINQLTYQQALTEQALIQKSAD